jgi:hypothetical protein
VTRLRDIRQVMAHCLRVGLASEDGAPVAVHAAPPARVQPPCVIIYPGLAGQYLGRDDVEESVTWCEEIAYYSLVLLHGTRGDLEQAMDTFDDWLEALPAALTDVAATEWTDADGRVVSTGGRSPVILDVGAPVLLQLPAETGPVMASLQVDVSIPRSTH